MAYSNRMPLPNSFSASGDGLNIAAFIFNSPQREEQYDLHTKFDFKLNDANHLYVRWSQGEQNTIGDAANAGRPRFPDNWRSSPTSTFVNEFIFGISDFGFSFTNPNTDPNHQFIFNLPTDFNSAFTYNARSFRTYQFVNNMTFDLSPHVIKAGTNIRLGRSTDDRSGVAGAVSKGALTLVG
jgi:hypothetical protein